MYQIWDVHYMQISGLVQDWENSLFFEKKR
jgi:hypothetical protein